MGNVTWSFHSVVSLVVWHAYSIQWSDCVRHCVHAVTWHSLDGFIHHPTTMLSVRPMYLLFIGWLVVFWMGTACTHTVTAYTVRTDMEKDEINKIYVLNRRHRFGDEHIIAEHTQLKPLSASSLLTSHCWLRYIMHERFYSDWAVSCVSVCVCRQLTSQRFSP